MTAHRPPHACATGPNGEHSQGIRADSLKTLPVGSGAPAGQPCSTAWVWAVSSVPR